MKNLHKASPFTSVPMLVCAGMAGSLDNLQINYCCPEKRTIKDITALDSKVCLIESACFYRAQCQVKIHKTLETGGKKSMPC